MIDKEFATVMEEIKSLWGIHIDTPAAKAMHRVMKLLSKVEVSDILDQLMRREVDKPNPAMIIRECHLYRQETAERARRMSRSNRPPQDKCGLCGDTGMVTGICKVNDKSRNLGIGYSYAFRCGCTSAARLSKRIPDYMTDAVKEEFDWHTYDNSGPATEADIAKLRAVIDKLSKAFDPNKRGRISEVRP